MIHPAIPATLLALAGPFAAAMRDVPPPAGSLAGVQITQLSIHERVIIRVPRMSRMPARTYAPPREWKEHKGPKCIAVAEIAGAMLNKEGAVDLVMDDQTRLRARLDGDCKPLDYYSGFYLRPGPDGLICKDRDAIRMRSGARCEIDGFKSLRPKK
ncbi:MULTISPECIES: hypothetical protein [unclassified Sphingomonas]|jgi:hypothetical protein|uniref:hypothetical protein n=1 Tax=unclassified Sphingomonas TaxID=196159 RepID=UPI0006F6DBF1|nr:MULTISPECIES: hypothetical protein [unclassified Sphingomonas]KQN29167.1 hypothetical protein ASE88_09400 [Sphingomonas sp. Leaf38]KQN31639.1 hypothetical protein ASF00_02265 [Sphingomonas sp. Leaf34]